MSREKNPKICRYKEIWSNQYYSMAAAGLSKQAFVYELEEYFDLTGTVTNMVGQKNHFRAKGGNFV